MSKSGVPPKSRTEVHFEPRKGDTVSLSIEGLDISKDPAKIRKLMDLLELPEGTNATVTLVASDVIVR